MYIVHINNAHFYMPNYVSSRQNIIFHILKARKGTWKKTLIYIRNLEYFILNTEWILEFRIPEEIKAWGQYKQYKHTTFILLSLDPNFFVVLLCFVFV